MFFCDFQFKYKYKNFSIQIQMQIPIWTQPWLIPSRPVLPRSATQLIVHTSRIFQHLLALAGVPGAILSWPVR